VARSTLTPAGILVPDSRISTATLSSTDSTFQQAGPKAGGAVALPSGAVVALEGEQAADIVVSATRGGPPLPTGGARIKWRPSAQTNDNGWAPPTWHEYSTGASTMDESELLDGTQLASGSVLVVAARGAAADTVSARWEPTTDTWTAGGALPYAASSAAGSGLLCIRQAEDGTVYALQSDATAPILRYLLVKSTDDGATWAEVTQLSFRSAASTAPVSGKKGRWWLTASGTHVLVLIDQTSMQTWTSTDGVQWDLVGTLSTLASYGTLPAADVALTAAGRLVYVYASSAGSADIFYSRSCAPTQDPSTAAEVTIVQSTGNAAHDACLFAAETGRVWVWVSWAADATQAHLTEDSGATWRAAGEVYEAGDDTQDHTRRAVRCSGGYAVLRPDLAFNQVFIFKVGGWGTWEPYAMGANKSVDDAERLTYAGPTAGIPCTGVTHHPEVTTAPANWTQTDGGGTEVSGLQRQLTTTGAETFYYSATSATEGRSACAFIDVEMSSGGNNSQLRAGWKLQVLTGTGPAIGHAVECRLFTSGFRLANLAGSVLATVSRTMTQVTQFQVCIEAGNRIEVYYRSPGDAEWTSAYQAAGPFSLVSLTGAFAFQWGNIVAGGAVSLWRFVGVTWVKNTGTSSKDDLWRCTQSTDTARQPVFGRPLSAHGGSLGSPATLPRVSGREVLAISDSLTVAPRYAYPIEAIDPRRSPSPRRTWRSTDTSEQHIAWELDATYTASMRCVGVYLANANFRWSTLEYHNGAAWAALVTLNLFGGTYALVRNGVTVTTTTGDLRWFEQGEAVGGSVVFASGDVRTITANDSGQGDTSWRLTCSGIDGTESTAASGDIRLPRGFAFQFAATDIRRLRLKIANQDTATGYFELGALVIGQVYAVGPQEWGTAETSTPDVQTYELPGYHLRARRSPPARRWGVEWPMQSLSALRTTATASPFYAPDGAPSVRYGMQSDTYQLLRGLVEEGADAVPVVFLPSMSTTDSGAVSGSTATETRRDVLWYAYAADVALSSTIIVGDEGTDELLRVGRLTLEEIV